MPSRAPVMRLFVAVYPPPGQADEMLLALARLDLPPHRATPAPQVHLTLHFVGDRHERDLASVIESVERSAAGIGAFTLTPARCVTLPVRGEARLVALETDAPPGLLEIQRRLVHRLADEKHKGKDRFMPHLTLCRFAQPARMPRIDAPVRLAAIPVHEIRLMKSVLRPGGAEHAVVHVTPLAQSGRPQ